MLDIVDCFFFQVFCVNHTPQTPQNPGVKESHKLDFRQRSLGGAAGQRVTMLMAAMALGHLLIMGHFLITGLESGRESGQGRDKLVHPATTLSALASGFYSTLGS